MKNGVSIIWFRNDLRLKHNNAIYALLKNSEAAVFLFIFDDSIHCDNSKFGSASRCYLHHSLKSLSRSIPLYIAKGQSFEVLKNIVADSGATNVYVSQAIEPWYREIDAEFVKYFESIGVGYKVFQGNTLLDHQNVKNVKGDIYKVFTHFWNNAKKLVNAEILPNYDVNDIFLAENIQNNDKNYLSNLDDLKLLPKSPNWSKNFRYLDSAGESGALEKLECFITNSLMNYKEGRNFPASNATSGLSVNLRFGEIHPLYIYRRIESLAYDGLSQSSEAFLMEIGWREFSYYLLYHFPKMIWQNFNQSFDNFHYINDKNDFAKWKNGQTGYPIVDAGMRELFDTGYMHNRVRMIVASFLTKHLLIDWRWGAEWFFDTLLDADIASNTVSWQWVAGCGVDAAPYFRIFNPILQGEKFDADCSYIMKWVPEIRDHPSHQPFAGGILWANYPKPMIDHAVARNRALSKLTDVKKTF